MTYKIFQVDAFTDTLFSGNPAAVVPLEKWLSDQMLQHIAFENNLSETAFITPITDGFYIRWFTPAREVDLCGHATLATAYVLFEHLDYRSDIIHFTSASGTLNVTRAPDKSLQMDFPAIASKRHPDPRAYPWLKYLNPIDVLTSKQDLMIVLSSEDDIITFNPANISIKDINERGVIVTAKGRSADFVSRCFYPELSVEEDPVTGSAHCQLAPYWSKQLKKTTLNGQQISKRGGSVECEIQDDRVILSGNAVTYLIGEILI